MPRPDPLDSLTDLPDPADALPAAEPFDWREYLHLLRQRYWIILLTLACALVLAFSYIARTAPVYASRSTLILEQQADQILRIESVRREDIRFADMMNTLVETINSFTLARRVVERNRLERDPTVMPKGPEGEEPSVESVAGFLMGSARARLRPNTRLVDIVVEHTNPEVARRVADLYAEEFIRASFDQRTEAARSANQYLVEESERLRERVRRAEEALQSYIMRQNASSLEERLDTVVERLKGVGTLASQARSDRIALETDIARAREVGDNPAELLNLPSIANSAAVATLSAAYAGRLNDLGSLSLRYRAKHPRMIALNSEIEMIRIQLEAKALEVARLMEKNYSLAKENEARFAEELKEQEKNALELNQKAIEYNALKRELESESTLYNSVLSRMKETDLTKSVQASPVRIMERAVTSSVPVRPNKRKILLGALFGGVASGVGIILGLRMLDRSIKSVDQAEMALGCPVLAAVPARRKLSSAKRGGKEDRRIDTISSPSGLIAESFRTLRAGLSLLAHDASRTSILFTSALPGEGKTFCACNYGVVLAQQGLRTLLIDADLRKPAAARLFLGDDPIPGLSDLLLDGASLTDSILESGVPGLSLISPGRRAAHPAELLSGPAFGKLLRELTERFDRIVIDSAPILAVSDTLLLAPHVAATCVVVHSFKTPKMAVLRAFRAISDVARRPAGIILNRIPENVAGYSYYHQRSYGRSGVYGNPVGETAEKLNSDKSRAGAES
jgi:succinoglycan biosynthesis transport protein ExoP